ncbi:MAG TPA: hypothetical protein VGA40_09950, partial [Candidatus Acidoferrales bacterium]
YFEPDGQLRRGHGPAAHAQYEALVGNKEKALALLEQALNEGDMSLGYFYRSPSFKPLRSEPRFQAIGRRLKLPVD